MASPLAEAEIRRLGGLSRELLRRLDAAHPGAMGRAQQVAVLSVATGQRLGVPDLARLRFAAELSEAGRLLADSDRHMLFIDEAIPHEPLLEPCVTVIRHQAERWDGGGFPSGLAGSAIPLESRILAAALARASGQTEGSHLDPEVVAAMAEIAPLVQPIGEI